jgi:hypothetical protein
MSFIVNMKAMIHGVAFHVGNKTADIDDCHAH